MKPTEDLFELIKSLSKAEKRYFKLMSSIHGNEKTYIKLFEAIENQKNYDEQEIKKMFAGEPFVRQLSFTKNYLYNSILKSLEIFYVDSDTLSMLFSAIRKTDILMKRNLLEQAYGFIKRNKRLALQHEQYEALNILLRQEMEYYRAVFFAGTPKDIASSYEKQIVECINALQNQIAYDVHSFNMLSHLSRAVRSRSHTQTLDLKKQIERPKLFGQKKQATIIASFYELVSDSAYYFFKEDFKAAKNCAVQMLKLSVEYPFFKKDKPAIYITALHNKLICEARLKQFSEFDKTIIALKEIKTPHARHRNTIFYSVYGTGSYVYSSTGNVQKGLQLCNELSQMENTPEFLSLAYAQKVLMYYNTACIYFCAGEYSNVIKWINKILNDSRQDTRADIYGMSKLLNILTHYEMGHEDFLSYITRSTYRYLDKNNRLSGFEKLILKFAARYMTGQKNKKEFSNKLPELKNEVIAGAKDEMEKKVIQDSLFYKWIISKLEKRPISEILRESI